jgi:hypothetical protein
MSTKPEPSTAMALIGATVVAIELSSVVSRTTSAKACEFKSVIDKALPRGGRSVQRLEKTSTFKQSKPINECWRGSTL